MARNIEDEKDGLNIIGNGTTLTGDVSSTGDIRIDGKLQGNLNSKSKLVLGASGKLIGEVFCKNAEVSGQIEGKITVEELLVLKSSSKIYGDIIASKLSIEPGAVFTGTCNMGGNVKNQEIKIDKPADGAKKQG
ncbi:MAG: polymer-forming cytoskeletal protein [Bacteroidales bacterium]|jgi:cytoskeletal protein CcmA (bactofilin family)|nr:polymer-forming cytoskeletal protein [Bacteroidales bacterium]MDD4215734.1 polymer-forming cytoskeletal protein [Bacteroidales bacterium]MDY0140341.1 polymer-forming cytoskeletal protein [Bacteroidales bacterium]